ncbi:class I SAM-dependent methyltransferase [Halalkalibacter alkalisediminis]|uniref:Class I SAM-dependent methyltransferase n=1 Tax=Halalkalibacter alkalisediminis TaxID=935616 RepID=A0ABV6NG91_9BACI|nr:class I SAM-dependent methyltransferase [Halalkalibacter alkalisediminis]
MDNLSYIDFLAEFSIQSAHPGGKAATEAIFKKEEISQKTKILDVGCGTGETASFLAHSFHCEVVAIDPHPTMLKKARERFRNDSVCIQLVEGSVEHLPFESETFDHIIIESVLTFVNVEKSLKECKRVLKEGGTLILNEMTLLEPLSDEDIERLKVFYQFSECNEEHVWKEHLFKAGFKQIEKLPIYVQDLIEVNELELSVDMNPQLFDILDEHERLLDKFKGKMGNSIFHCKK